MAPRAPQDAPKRLPRRPREAPGPPKTPPRGPQDPPRGPQELPKRPPRASKRTQEPPRKPPRPLCTAVFQKNRNRRKQVEKKRVDNGHPRWSIATVAQKPKALSKRSNTKGGGGGRAKRSSIIIRRPTPCGSEQGVPDRSPKAQSKCQISTS